MLDEIQPQETMNSRRCFKSTNCLGFFVLALAAGALLSPPTALAQPSTNGLLLWLDSSYSDSVVRDAGGRVTAWLNKAPGANNAVSYTGNNDNNTSASYNAVPPNYVAGPNGVGVVNFTGNGYLDNLAFSSQTPADLTVFLLATASTNLGYFSAWMAFNQSQSANDWQTGLNIDQGQYPSTTLNRLNVEGAKGGGLGGFQLVNGSFNFGTYYVFEIDYGGGPANNHSLVTALVGGASVASRSESPNAVALNNFYLGTRADVYGYNNTDNHDLVGQIAAVLVYDHQLTGSDLTQAQSYLSNFFLQTNRSTSSSPQPNSFTYNNFGTTKLLRFNGSATNMTTSDGPVLELTPASANQAGSAFTSNHIVLAPNGGFSTFFTFRLSHPGNTPEDGITFTLQSDNPFSLGTPAGGLGYAGITNSLSVEFDTFNNGAQGSTPGDLDNNHVAVNVNGVLNNSVARYVTNNAMNDGNIWYAWIDYTGAKGLLEVRLSETPIRPLPATLAAIVNLPAILSVTNVYVGFTGATGAGWNQQDILSWKFMALPTARFTARYALTNISPSFTLTNGIAFKNFSYSISGVFYTNTYGSTGTFTKEPDGSVDFVSDLDSTPIVDGSNGGSGAIGVGGGANETEAMVIISDYADTDPGFAGNGLALTMAGGISAGQLFGESFPGTTEAETETFLDNWESQAATIGALLPGLTPIHVDPFAWGLSAMNNHLLESFGLPPVTGAVAGYVLGPQCGNQIVTYSGAANRGTVTVREQLIYAPQLPLVLALPRKTGTNFSFAFLTVSNQSYTVWANTNLTTPNWVSTTNVLGDGYIQNMTVPVTNSAQSFYQLSSP